MKLLVTGATGFIGGAICRELSARGDLVRAFHRASSDTSLLDDLPVEHHIGDLNNLESLSQAVKGMDAVIHCAAQLGSHGGWQNYQTVTIQGTRNLLNVARGAQVRRFIHTSSVAALGVPDTGMPGQTISLISETHTWNYHPSRWPYGYAKYLAELEVQRAVALGLDAVIVNPSSVFGPGDLLRNRNSIIRMASRPAMRFSAPGGMNVVHVKDVVRGHLAALEYGCSGERYILGGENMPHVRFLTLIKESAGIHTRLMNLPIPLIQIIRRLSFLASSFLHIEINPGMFNLAGYHFYYDLEKSMRDLRLPTPLDARQSVMDAYQWFEEHPIKC